MPLCPVSPEPTALEPPPLEPGAGKAAWRAYGGQSELRVAASPVASPQPALTTTHVAPPPR